MKNGWASVPLSAVCEIKSTLVDPREPENIDRPHVGAGNMVTQSDELIEVRTAREEGLKSNKYQFDSSMILYSKIRPYLMKVSRPDFGGVCSADVYPLFPRDSLLDRDFLFHLLLTKKFTDYAIAGSARAGMPKVNRNHLFAFEFGLPTLPEQRRIVGILDEAFAGIATAKANAEKNLQNARALFESHLNAVFTQRGDGWTDTTLGEVCENLDSKRVPITKSKRVAGEYPYYGASGIVDYVNDYIFDEDLLLVSEDGANLLARTYPIAFAVSGKVWVNNHAHVLRLPNMASQQFMEFYLNSIKLDPYVSGMAQPKLNQKSLNSIPVPCPPKPQRKAIVAQLDSLQEETKRLESIYQRKLAALDELKTSLLHQAFSGKL